VSDGLDELRRRAYGPPRSAADARAAQAELRRLADGERMPDLELPRLRPVPSPPRRGMLLLAAACLGAAVLATGIAAAPRPSLAVFASTQHGVPEWPGSMSDDGVRWLGGLGPWNVFAFETGGGNVCVSAFLSETSGGGSCTSRAAFLAQGITFGTDISGEDLQVSWGPTGGAHLEGRPR